MGGKGDVRDLADHPPGASERMRASLSENPESDQMSWAYRRRFAAIAIPGSGAEKAHASRFCDVTRPDLVPKMCIVLASPEAALSVTSLNRRYRTHASPVNPQGLRLASQQADVAPSQIATCHSRAGSHSKANAAELGRQFRPIQQPLPMDFLIAPVQVADSAKGGDSPRQQPASAVFFIGHEHGPVISLEITACNAASGHAPRFGDVQEKNTRPETSESMNPAQ